MNDQRESEFPSLNQLPGGAKLGAGRRLRLRASREIAASKINLGCECLDRGMWYPEKAFPHLAETGVKWARVQTGWSQCEKEKGKYDFAWLDPIVDQLLGMGIQPWFNVTYGNILHTGAPAWDAVGWTPMYDPAAAKAWRSFVGALTEHFRDRIERYEIWNEPDITVFWKQEASNPRKYAELVALTAREIRRFQPEAYIVGGAQAHGTSPAGLEYLESALQAGMGRHINAFSYHLYRPRPEGARLAEIQALRTLLQRHGLQIDLWQAESGCPSVMSTAEAMANIPWNEPKQAKWMLRRMLCDLDFEVDMTTHFHLSDFHNYFKDGPVNKPAYFGLLRNETYERKPAFYAFQSVCNLFDFQTEIDRELQLNYSLDETTAPGSAPLDWLLVKFVPFVRRGWPLLAYWYPSELNPEPKNQPRFAPGKLGFELSRPDGLRLREPVLVDPVRQTAYSVSGQWKEFGFTCNVNRPGRLTFDQLPITDYPLFLTDAAALDFAE